MSQQKEDKALADALMNLVMDDDPKPNATMDPAEFATFGHRGDDDMMPPDMMDGDDPLSEAERSNLYVSNISTDVTDDELRDLFKPYGVIINSRIMVDIHTCKTRGFGFVQFQSPPEAAKAVKAVDGSVHRSQTLMVRLASRKTRQPGNLTPKMFLRNVPAGISEDELRRFCQSFGAVTSCAVRPDTQHGVVTDDTTGGVSQVAYVMFGDLGVAKHAAQVLNNTKPWPACTHPLLAKLLDSNAKRRDDSITSMAGMRSATGSQTTTTGMRRADASGTSRMGGSASGTTTLTMPSTPGSGVAPVYAHPGVMHPGIAHPGMHPGISHPGIAMPPMSSATYAHPHGGYAPMSYAQPSVAAPYGASPMHQGIAGYQVVMQPTLQPIYAPMPASPGPQGQGMQGMPGMGPMPGFAYPGGYPMPNPNQQGPPQMPHVRIASQPGSVTSQHAASGSRNQGAGGRAPKNPFA